MLNNNEGNDEINNKEEKADLVETKIEEVLEEPDIEESEEDNIEDNIEANIDTESIVECDDKVSFLNSLAAVFIDEAIVGVISFGVLYLVDLLMRSIAGYYIVEKAPMYLIIFVIITLFYTSIMENKKNGQTFGKKIMKLKTTKIK